jgi:hypothetical protein
MTKNNKVAAPTNNAMPYSSFFQNTVNSIWSHTHLNLPNNLTQGYNQFPQETLPMNTNNQLEKKKKQKKKKESCSSEVTIPKTIQIR